MEESGDEMTNTGEVSNAGESSNAGEGSSADIYESDSSLLPESGSSTSLSSGLLPPVSTDKLEDSSVNGGVNSMASYGPQWTTNYGASRVMMEMMLRNQMHLLQFGGGFGNGMPYGVDAQSKDKQPIESGGVGNMFQFHAPNPYTYMQSNGMSYGVDAQSKDKQPIESGGVGNMFQFHAPNPYTYMQSNQDHAGSKDKQPVELGGVGNVFQFYAPNPYTYMQSNQDHAGSKDKQPVELGGVGNMFQFYAPNPYAYMQSNQYHAQSKDKQPVELGGVGNMFQFGAPNPYMQSNQDHAPSKDKQPVELGGVGNTFQFGAPNPHTYVQSNQDRESLVGIDNNTASNNDSAARANPMKLVSPSGCSQWFGKHNLKEKGVAAAGPTMDQDDKKVSVDCTTGVSSDAKLNPSSTTNNLSLDEVAAAGPAMSNDGISLREWLKSEQQNINKVERLNIFRQIVMLVDLAHSREVALRDLRPSFFKLFSSDEIKYVGSFGQKDCLESVVVQDTPNSEHHLSRKRYSEQEPHSNKNQKLNDANIQENDSGFDMSEHTNRYQGYKPGASDISSQLLTTLNFQLVEKWWYASPEEFYLRGSTSSNIYSLGILLFELFCCFESWEIHAATMSNLRYRILPPKFSSENPKEAGFCLWLLHPEPSSRPSIREVLQSQLIVESQELLLENQLQSSLVEEDMESELLLDFLTSLNDKKEKQTSKLIEEIGCLEADFAEVEKRYVLRANECHSTMHEGPSNKIGSGYGNKKPSDSEMLSRSSSTKIHEEKSLRNSQIEKAYFSMRSQIQLPDIDSTTRSDPDFLKGENEGMKHKVTDRLGSFFGGLCKYALYNKFELRTTVRNSDMIHSSNVICSMSFDRDEDYFATAGVEKKIKIFEFNPLLRDNVDIHYPVVEMTNNSKLTCVTWNSYIKNYLVTTDFDGVVQLWDVTSGQGFSQFRHEKRTWCVDFCPIDPKKFASGGDDSLVKLWSINEAKSTGLIKCLGSVCCVQFSPHSTHLLACGAADYRTYCFDIRNTRFPWCVMGGTEFGKAVCNVKFVDSETIVSAYTDSTLRIWDLNKTNTDQRQISTNALSLTLTGHTNEKHFVGLAVNDGYIACGSETNEVFAYYKSFPIPITSYKFGSTDPITGQEIAGDCEGQFVSSVCWRTKSNMVLAASSTGSIKLLQLL